MPVTNLLLQDIDLLSETLLSKNDNPLNTISAPYTNDYKSDETSLSLFYKKTFKNPIQEFTGEASYYNFGSDEINDFTNTRYLYNSDSIISTYARDGR